MVYKWSESHIALLSYRHRENRLYFTVNVSFFHGNVVIKMVITLTSSRWILNSTLVRFEELCCLLFGQFQAAFQPYKVGKWVCKPMMDVVPRSENAMETEDNILKDFHLITFIGFYKMLPHTVYVISRGASSTKRKYFM